MGSVHASAAGAGPKPDWPPKPESVPNPESVPKPAFDPPAGGGATGGGGGGGATSPNPTEPSATGAAGGTGAASKPPGWTGASSFFFLRPNRVSLPRPRLRLAGASSTSASVGTGGAATSAGTSAAGRGGTTSRPDSPLDRFRRSPREPFSPASFGARAPLPMRLRPPAVHFPSTSKGMTVASCCVG